VLREDRLGTLMLRTERIWDGGAVTAAFAPAISRESKLYDNIDLPSLDPMFDRTNAQDRFLLKASADLAADFSPEFLVYREGTRNALGANLTRSIGQSTIAYAEWSGARRTSLIDEALDYGRATGTLPAAAPSVLPEDSRTSFQNQLSLGASYTNETKITFNLEYHYDEAAFSPQDWRNWFRIGAANTGRPPVTNELWYIREFVLDRQEPISRNSAFLRADWVDALVPHLELTGLVNADLHDGSSTMQLTADYYLSSAWTVGAIVAANLGAKRSSAGSLPQAASVLFKLARYF